VSPATRALIIKPEPLRKVLAGTKTYEVRSRPTRLTGQVIALSEKGTNRILGVATIDQCLGPLTLSQVRASHGRMGIKTAELMADLKYWRRECAAGRVYAWVLRAVKRLPRPVPFRNPSGAVVWARVPPRIARHVKGLDVR
jgi:hypothetical protein